MPSLETSFFDRLKSGLQVKTCSPDFSRSVFYNGTILSLAVP